jgi:crotonobetainyl-CoA hydratase
MTIPKEAFRIALRSYHLRFPAHRWSRSAPFNPAEKGTMTETLRIDRHGPAWEITLDRPKANAIDIATSRALGHAFVAFRDDPLARVAILTAAGSRFFSAGWDLKEAATTTGQDDYGPGGFAGLTELFDLDKPVIAAVNGLAVGGGFELALSCDLIVAVQGAEFFLPEASIGLIPNAGGILRLPRRLPPAIAMEMMLTGKRLSAQEALGFGLINAVVSPGDLLPAARRLAERVLASAPLASVAIKAVVAATEGLSVAQGYALMGSGQIAAYERLRRSEDYLEGARAFAERRPPVWRGH